METLRAIDLMVYSQLILIYILIGNLRKKNRDLVSKRLFSCIIYTLTYENILEGVTWALNGTSIEYGHEISVFANTALLLFNSFPAVFWVTYADYKIFADWENLKKRMVWYFIPFYVTIGLLLVNLRTGFVFTIREDNTYERGVGVTVIALMTYALVTCLYLMTRRFKRKINGRLMQSIFIFMLIPVAAGIIQMLAYGLLLIWPAFILATLIAFFQIEKEAIQKDPLTGLAVRELLEQRVQYLMSRGIGFSIIMIDMNDFKGINDRFGHHEGDQALLLTADLFVKNQHKCDMICRYGGDEFTLLLDTSVNEQVQDMVTELQKQFEEFNKTGGKPYKLSLSAGYASWNLGNQKTLDEILRDADTMMYQKKNEYKHNQQEE